jgi:hypothetical protein
MLVVVHPIERRNPRSIPGGLLAIAIKKLGRVSGSAPESSASSRSWGS